MSQNGPYPGQPWSGGSSEEPPYGEPADPWGDHSPPPDQQHWGANPPSIPQQQVSYHSAPMQPVASGWDSQPPHFPPSAPPPRRNTPIVALVVVLGLLIVVGLGTTAWLISKRGDDKASGGGTPTPSASASDPSAGSEDARFVTKGQCVVNQGTDDQPDMRKSACAAGAYEVLDVIKGKTSGEKDAEGKCSKVAGYTNWYFYDSEFDDFDFVLCLKRQ